MCVCVCVCVCARALRADGMPAKRKSEVWVPPIFELPPGEENRDVVEYFTDSD